MLIFIISFPRTGGMILCETLGQHPDITPLNEIVGWKEKIPPGRNYAIKVFWFNIHNQYSGADIFKDYPGAKYIFLTRDPLDIAASYKRIKATGQDARPYLPERPLKEEAAWISAVKQYKDQLAWLNKNKENPGLLIISFEDMILKKQETFKKIFDHIGFSYDDSLRNFVDKYVSNNADSKRIGKATSTAERLRIGSYNNVLTRWEIKKINLIFPKSERVS